MRVSEICLNATVYDFITKGNYPYQEQWEYGKVEINVSNYTPHHLGSFLTGTAIAGLPERVFLKIHMRIPN